MSLAAVVQHLNVLEESGVVRSHKVGRVRTCRVEPKAFAHVESWIAQRRTQWDRQFDRLGEFLAAQEDKDRERKKKP
jgi:DNA-binding transcriptional ArsR family regulator